MPEGAHVGHSETLDRGAGDVEEDRWRARKGIVRSGAALALALAVSLAALAPSIAFAEPAFGDSDWVAPVPGPDADTPSDPGPRVAPLDKDRIGETVLRAPFRLAFLPLRLLARGTEKLIGMAGGGIAPAVGHAPQPKWRIEPVFTADPGGGIRVTRLLDAPGNAKIFLNGTYGYKDRRRAKLTFRSAQDNAIKGVHVEALYEFRPNTTFYGVGNFSDLANKTIWLHEEARVDGRVHLGRAIRHELNLLAGLSATGARSGFNGGTGTRRIEDVFTPTEAPFLERGSRVFSFGAMGDLAVLDDVRAPRKGVHGRARAEQFKAADNSDLDYRRYHLEARGYIPVLSDRRVIALRVLHNWVDPAGGSPDVPYYRLPESNNDLRFNGYRTHRFADRHLVLAQAEYRWWVTNKIFALINASGGEVASSAQRLRFADLHEAYGIGLRYGYNDRRSARLDLAKGSEGLVFNLTLGDAF